MPTYEYRCAKCGEDIEVFQTFSDKPLTRHAGCGGKLSKVLSSVGIVLKGSGFYKTDNRSGSGKSKRDEPAAASSESSSTSESKSESSTSGSESKSSSSSDRAKSNGAKSDGSKSSDKKPAAKSA